MVDLQTLSNTPTSFFKKSDKIRLSTNKRSSKPNVFESLLHNKITHFMELKLSKFLTGFQRNHKTQHALLDD